MIKKIRDLSPGTEFTVTMTARVPGPHTPAYRAVDGEGHYHSFFSDTEVEVEAPAVPIFATGQVWSAGGVHWLVNAGSPLWLNCATSIAPDGESNGPEVGEFWRRFPDAVLVLGSKDAS